MLRKYYRLIRQRVFSFHQKRSLVEILEFAHSSPTTFREVILWFEDLVEWINSPINSQQGLTGSHPQIIRIKMLVKTLQENEKYRIAVQNLVKTVLIKTDPLDFYSDAGLINSHAFFRELMDRVILRHLPSHRNYENLSVLMEELFKGEADAVWIEALPVNLLVQMGEVLQFEPEFLAKLQRKYYESLIHAFRILSVRLASLSSFVEFRNRVLAQDRFLLIQSLENQNIEILATAEKIVEEVYQSLEESGVSIELVFLLERMRNLLGRLRLIEEAVNNPASVSQHLRFVGAILKAQEEKNSVISFLSSNLQLLSIKITERSGVTGEHYIARTAKESRQLFFSAAGGGLVTVLTTLIKSGVSKLGLPLFVEGFLAWVNYSVSFMFMQAFHMTLATKTPAMTASVLAAKLKNVQSAEEKKAFLQEVRAIFRSGFLAILGNVLFVILGSVILDMIIFAVSGSHVLSEQTAIDYLYDHHIFMSFTIWYAIYTGGVLWLGSAIGGWFENWYTYRGLPHALEDSVYLKAYLGKVGAQRVSQWFTQSIMGIATNIALGFLLAFSTVFGKFIGIPIDVRHVTLSSGTIGFSLAAIGDFKNHVWLLVFSISGIFFIGLLNLGVSFIISLLVAGQARDIKFYQYPMLFKNIFSRNKTQ